RLFLGDAMLLRHCHGVILERGGFGIGHSVWSLPLSFAGTVAAPGLTPQPAATWCQEYYILRQNKEVCVALVPILCGPVDKRASQIPDSKGSERLHPWGEPGRPYPLCV